MAIRRYSRGEREERKERKGNLVEEAMKGQTLESYLHRRWKCSASYNTLTQRRLRIGS